MFSLQIAVFSVLSNELVTSVKQQLHVASLWNSLRCNMNRHRIHDFSVLDAMLLPLLTIVIILEIEVKCLVKQPNLLDDACFAKNAAAI